MKKLFILLSLLLAFTVVNAQQSMTGSTRTSGSIIPAGTASVVLYESLIPQYDVSLQIVPTIVSGDSSNVAVAVWQSNSLAGTAYTELTTYRDTITSTNGKLISISDFGGAKLKVIGTGITTDTVTITVYPVYKLPPY